MDTGSQAGMSPATAIEDKGVLDVADEVFENVYDAPFITVNRINGDLVGLVSVASDEAVTDERIQTAVDVGLSEGFRFHSARPGEYSPEWIEVFFSPGLDGEA